MTAGYSGTPLAKKLGFKEGQKIWFINEPDHYLQLFDSLPDCRYYQRKPQEADLIHVFFTHRKQLENRISKIIAVLSKQGSIWISWPKKSSAIASDLDRDWIRSYVLNQGLVDVKVCAVDEDWSGLKFMYRIKDR